MSYPVPGTCVINRYTCGRGLTNPVRVHMHQIRKGEESESPASFSSKESGQREP